MTPTHAMLGWVRKRMLDLCGWRNGPSAKYRRYYRRLERAEAYLIGRASR